MLTKENPRTKKARESFIRLVEKEGYRIKEDNMYESSSKHIELICPNSHIYLVTPNKFQQGRRCSKCSGYAKKNTNNFKKEVSKIDDSYEVVGEYINAREPLLMRHDCGSVFKIRPTNFLKGRRCKRCSIKERGIKSRTTHEDFCGLVETLTKGEYRVLSQYVTVKEKVKIKHTLCGYEWEVRPLNFTFHNSRCPNCNESKGEAKIAKYLDDYGMHYERYKKFDGLRYKKPLECDFYLPEYRTIIEFDGGQHFYPVEHFGGEEAFKEVQIRDEIKNDYAKENNLTMIRVPYWDYENIEEIISSNIKKVTQ